MVENGDKLLKNDAIVFFKMQNQFLKMVTFLCRQSILKMVTFYAEVW